MKELFRKTSSKISNMVGSAGAFMLALSVVIVWGLTGPMFGFSDTWQLVINTGTTIVTFLMVFLIQNTQNRDSKSLHLKLDELIHSSKGARDSFLGLDDLSDDALNMLDEQFKAIHDKVPNAEQLHKIHSKIAAEKQRRGTLKSAGDAITSILKNPLTGFKSDDNNKK
jgi:low affinity Fe/Cu permease